MDISKAIEIYNEESEHKKALATLSETTGAFFFLDKEGKIDKDKTLRGKAIAEEFGHVPGGKTFAEVQRASKPKTTAPAAPGCGALLFDHQNTVLGIDYTGVAPSLLQVVALVAEQRGGIGAKEEADLVYGLRKRGALPDTREWDEAQTKWVALSQETNRSDEEETLYRAVLRRLVYSPERDTTQRPFAEGSVLAPAQAPPCTMPAAQSVCASCGQPGPEGHNFRHPFVPKLAPVGKSLFILSHSDNRMMLNALKMHGRLLSGVSLIASTDCPAGQSTAVWLGAQIDKASAVVVLVSASLGADDALMSWVRVAIAHGKRLIPVVVGAMMPIPELRNLTPLPRDGKPVRSDEGWVEVVQGLGTVLGM